MKNILFVTALALILFSCGSGSNKNSTTDSQADQTDKVSTAVEVDSILANPGNYLEKTVSIKGLVVHTCRQTGKKMFLIGSDKNSPIKVVAGNNISLFEQSLEGETVIATGKITLMEGSGENHKNNKEHQEKGEHNNHSEETTSSDSTTGGCAAETNNKRYEMVCDVFSVVKE